MDFRKFFDTSTFRLLAVGDSNWDYYTMEFKNDEIMVVSLGKVNRGCGDSFFGNLKYFKNYVNTTTGKLVLTDYAKELLEID